MLYIFNREEELQTILQNDNSKSLSIISAIHNEEINGENFLEFEIPANHTDANKILEGGYVAFKDREGEFQLFEIKKINEIHGQTITKNIYCEHSFFELVDELIPYTVRRNTTPQDILTHILNFETVSRWRPGTVELDNNVSSFTLKYKNKVSAINTIIRRYGGELKFRITLNGNKIGTRYVDILTKRGQITGKRFEYGKDLNSVKRNIDIENIITAAYGFGKGMETPSGEPRVSIRNTSWNTANGDPLTKPAGQSFIEDSTYKNIYGRMNTDGTKRNRFGTFEDKEETDPIKLLEKTYQFLEDNKEPKISYEIEAIDLEKSSNLEFEKVRIGDDVYIIDKEFSPELRVQARILKIEWDLIQADKTKFTLGNIVSTISEQFQTVENTRQEIDLNKGIWEEGSFEFNMINDPSFENIPIKGNVLSNQTFYIDKDAVPFGNSYWWDFEGISPRIYSVKNSGIKTSGAIFDYQAAVVKKDDTIPFQTVPLHTGTGSGPYTFSCYVSSYDGTLSDGKARLEIYSVDNSGTENLLGYGELDLLSNDKYNWKRIIVKIDDVNLSLGTEQLKARFTVSSDSPIDFEYLLDGVQAVPLDRAVKFQPNSELYDVLNNRPGFHHNGIRNIAELQTGNLLLDFDGGSHYAPSVEIMKNGEIKERNSTAFEVSGAGQTLNTQYMAIQCSPPLYDYKNEVFNDAGFQFIAQEDGVYLFSLVLRLMNLPTSTEIYIRVYKNGSFYLFPYNEKQTGNVTINLSLIMNLREMDSIVPKIYSSNGGSIYAGGLYTQITGAKLAGLRESFYYS